MRFYIWLSEMGKGDDANRFSCLSLFHPTPDDSNDAHAYYNGSLHALCTRYKFKAPETSLDAEDNSPASEYVPLARPHNHLTI